MITVIDSKSMLSWIRDNSNGAVDMLQERFCDAKDIWAVGGTVLSCLLNKPLRDLDIIVDTDIDRAKMMGNLIDSTKTNSFGGMFFRWNNFPIDIWRLRDTFEIKSAGSELSIEDAIATLPYNLDKIAINLKSGRICDLGCIDGIRTRTIEYLTPRTQKLHIEAARAFALKWKTGYTFGPRTVELINNGRLAIRKQPELWNEVERSLSYKDPSITRYAELALK